MNTNHRTLLLLTLCLYGCTSIFYHPDHTCYLNPADLGLHHEDVFINTPEQPTLHAWFIKSSIKQTITTPTATTVLFLHGNAQNITSHLSAIYWLPSYGFNIMLIDYDGYGQSEGSPSPAKLQNSIVRAYDYMVQRPDVDPTRVVLYGQSLGGTIALYSAANDLQNKFALVIAESPFASYRRIAAEKVFSSPILAILAWYVPYLITDDFSPLSTVHKIRPTPLLLIHAGNDTIVPTSHSKALYQQANDPKKLWIVPETEHIEIFVSQDRRQYLVDLIKSVISSLHGVP